MTEMSFYHVLLVIFNWLPQILRLEVGLLYFHETEHVYFALDLQYAFLLFIICCSLLPWLKCWDCWTITVAFWGWCKALYNFVQNASTQFSYRCSV